MKTQEQLIAILNQKTDAIKSIDEKIANLQVFKQAGLEMKNHETYNNTTTDIRELQNERARIESIVKMLKWVLG